VREGADVERALGPSFFPLHTSYFQTQTHRPCNDETGVRGFPKTPTSRPRQTCDSPRPQATSCNSAPRMDAVRLLSLPAWMGRHPKASRSAFRCRTEIDVPTADQRAHSQDTTWMAIRCDGRSIQANASTRAALQVIRCRRVYG
jgi:hypothetical protein